MDKQLSWGDTGVNKNVWIFPDYVMIEKEQRQRPKKCYPGSSATPSSRVERGREKDRLQCSTASSDAARLWSDAQPGRQTARVWCPSVRTLNTPSLQWHGLRNCSAGCRPCREEQQTGGTAPEEMRVDGWVGESRVSEWGEWGCERKGGKGWVAKNGGEGMEEELGSQAKRWTWLIF